MKRVLHDVERFGRGHALVTGDRGKPTRVLAREVSDPFATAATHVLALGLDSVNHYNRDEYSPFAWLGVDLGGAQRWCR